MNIQKDWEKNPKISDLRAGTKIKCVLGKEYKILHKEETLTWVMAKNGQKTCFANCAKVEVHNV